MERGLNRLVDNIPDIGTAAYDGAMRDMVDEITNSDTLIPYLVASNINNGEVRATVLHSIKRYSTGFGGNNALHGKTLGLLGEVMDTQLPPLIQFRQDPNHDLVHTLLVEEVRVPPNTQVDAYFSLPVAENLMAAPTVAAGSVNINLACLCPIPLSWAPYFLNHKTPYQQALLMGRELMASLTNGDERTRDAPMLDWLRASCTILGINRTNRGHSILNVNLILESRLYSSDPTISSICPPCICEWPMILPKT
jgi:hypothetical protein